MRWIPAVAVVLAALASPAAADAGPECEVQAPPLPPAQCRAHDPAPGFVFYDPPCDYTPGPYPNSEAESIPHFWPLPGGATSIPTMAGLGSCREQITVRHGRGRRLSGSERSLVLDQASCAELRRSVRSIDAITIEASAGGSMGGYLRARHVAWMAAVGSAHLTLDVAVRRSSDLALLAPIADRIESLRIRIYRGHQRIDLSDLPSIPCLRSLAVEARVVSGVGALRGALSLEALELHASLSDAEIVSIGSIGSLRELRIWPEGGRSVEPFRRIRQIERLHTRARPALVRAFARAPLRRIVLSGPAGISVLRAAARHRRLQTLDLVLNEQVVDRPFRMLARFRELSTLVLAWSGLPPSLPRLPALTMLVGDGSVHEPFVDWMAAQPRLRTVHVAAADSVLGPRLPRANVYNIGRYSEAGILPAPPAPAHPQVDALFRLDEPSPLSSPRATRIDPAGGSMSWGRGRVRVRIIGRAMVAYYSRNDGREDEQGVDFIDADPALSTVALVARRDDDRVILRLENVATETNVGSARLVLFEDDPIHGVVVRNVWVGTSRAYWSGAAPAWTRMRR